MRLLLAALLIAMAAFNTGNNLIYLILAMMLSVLAVSVFAPALNMKGVSLRVSAPGPLFAKQRADVELVLRNEKRLLPAYSLKVLMPWAQGAPGEIPYVPAASEAACRAPVVFERRGIYSYGDFRVESSFPFIFFIKRRTLRVDGSVKVYPEIIETARLAAASGGAGGSYRRGGSDELLTLRDFIDGDDMKSIHWRSSAKAGRLMAKEFALEEPKKVIVALDDTRPLDAAAFEKAVSYAASVSKRLLSEGYMVGLWSSETELPPASGPEQLYKIMEALAVIREVDALPSNSPPADFVAKIFVLKSEGSALKRFAGDSALVVYARNI